LTGELLQVGVSKAWAIANERGFRQEGVKKHTSQDLLISATTPLRSSGLGLATAIRRPSAPPLLKASTPPAFCVWSYHVASGFLALSERKASAGVTKVKERNRIGLVSSSRS
jgi:hypothetical protein